MSEELNQEIQNTPDEGQPAQLSPIEVRALEMGWKPKDQFSGNEEDFVDAKEYVARQPLFDRISQQSREVKELRKAVEALKAHNGRIEQVTYERALKDLKEQRKEALREGDADKFDYLDTQIRQVEKQVENTQVPQETVSGEEHPTFVSWKQQNNWYENTKYMREFADDVGRQFMQQGLSPEEVLKEVSKAVRKEFPHKFENPARQAAPHTAAPAAGNSGIKKDNYESQLTAQEREVMKTLVRGGHITKEAYIADLVKIGRFSK